MSLSPYSDEVKFAGDSGTGGDLVAAVSGHKIRVLHFTCSHNQDLKTLTFTSGTGPTTIYEYQSRTMASHPHAAPHGLCETAVGEKLAYTTDAAATKVYISYILIPA